jgi:hypothetical protein
VQNIRMLVDVLKYCHFVALSFLAFQIFIFLNLHRSATVLYAVIDAESCLISLRHWLTAQCRDFTLALSLTFQNKNGCIFIYISVVYFCVDICLSA